MMYFSLLTLLGLSQVLLQCKGQVTVSPGQDVYYVQPEEDVTIAWTITGAQVSAFSLRSWFFITKNELLARISDDENVKIRNSSLKPGISITKPSTMKLTNVDLKYNGTYKFELEVGATKYPSSIDVFVLGKPTVTINCSSPITVDEDRDLICLCKGENGNPPADVIWYDKNSNPIGQKEKGEKILVLRNITEADGGTYICKAKSHTLMDEKSTEVKVSPNYEPTNTDIEFSSNPAVIGKEVTITCNSSGQPDPSYTIIHNGTININGFENTYTIPKVNWDDAGNYSCVAINTLGSNQSDTKILNVTVKGIVPSSTPTSSATILATSSTTKKSQNETVDFISEKSPLSPVIIAVIVIAVLLFLVVLIFVLYYFKRKKRDGHKSHSNVNPGGSGNQENHYELEDNELAGQYDSVSATTSSKKKPESSLPAVYAAVNKEDRGGKPLYATLDTVAMENNGSKKKRNEDRPPPTEYASIDFARGDQPPKADLV